MKRKSILSLFMLASLCFVACQSDDKVTSNPKVAQLDTLFTYLTEQGMYNGAVAIRDQGEVIFKEGYGIGSFERNTKFRPESQTEIASVSKQFTATGIMMLSEEGKLSVDDDINLYFDPALPLEGITIRHLLTHTSGVPDYERYFKENWNTSDLVYNRQILDFLYDEKPASRFAPGEKYEYSNLGYVLLAEIIAQVSGSRIDTFLQERIFDPAGMDHTGFYDRAAIFEMENYAPGMVWNVQECAYVRPETVEGNEFVWYLSGRFGPGRLTSTVEDLLKWDSLLYTTSVLSEESKELMFSSQVLVSEQEPVMHYGFGWRIPSAGILGQEVEHSGSWPGNYTHIKRYLDVRSTYVLLNNTYTPYMSVIREAIDAILKGEEFVLPKPILHDFIAKRICDPAFDREGWLDTHPDMSAYVVNKDAWARLVNQINSSDDSGLISFVERVDARIE